MVTVNLNDLLTTISGLVMRIQALPSHLTFTRVFWLDALLFLFCR